MSVLGVDLGTSGLRALLVDEGGQVIGAAERGYATQTPYSGWSEQDPALWIAALEEAVAELRGRYAQFGELRAIAVAGHMHGATLLGPQNEVLRPCILWNDTRSAAEAATLDAQDEVRALSGNIVFPGFTAPKLLWVRRHEAALFAQIARVVLPAAYLNFYLTGTHVTDMSDASGTSWLDIRRRDWSDRLLHHGAMRRDQMPRLVEGNAPAGPLRPELAQRWGLSQPVVVAGGAADNAAAACGIGAMAEGEGFVSLGTSGVILVARDRCAPAPQTALHSFCHAVPEKWYQMGVMLAATDCLNWLSRITGQSPAALSGSLGDTLRPPGRLGFLPYLSGERTPHNNAEIRGVFTGLSTDTDVSDMTRAAFEGVAFGLRDSATALRATGARFNALHVIGGGAASDYWVKLIATALGVTLKRPKEGAFGAARLALCAAGLGTASEVMRAPDEVTLFEPDGQLSEAFDRAYQRFRASYPAIAELTRPSNHDE